MLPEGRRPDAANWREPMPFLSSYKHTRSLRILMIATEAPPVQGGIARVVGTLKEGLQQQGHQVDILAYPEVGRLIFGEIRLSSLIFKLPRLLLFFVTLKKLLSFSISCLPKAAEYFHPDWSRCAILLVSIAAGVAGYARNTGSNRHQKPPGMFLPVVRA